ARTGRSGSRVVATPCRRRGREATGGLTLGRQTLQATHTPDDSPHVPAAPRLQAGWATRAATLPQYGSSDAIRQDTDARSVGRAGRAEPALRDRDDRYGAARHVEKLDTVAHF